MKIKIAVAALAVALGSSTALAQPRWYGFGPSEYGNVPPYHATRLVRAYGMRPVSSPVRMGRNYVVTAVDRYGQMRRVVVDARFGEVVRIVAVGRDAPRYGFRGGPDYYYDDDIVRPPRSLGGWRDTPPRPRARIPEDFDRLGPTPRSRPDGSVPQASIPADTGTVRSQDPGRIMEEEPAPSARAPDTAPAPETAGAPPTVEASPGDPAAVQLPPPPRAERTPAATPTPRARPQGENRRAATAPTQPVPPKPVPAEKKPPAPQNQTASPRVILPGGPAPKTERAGEPAHPATGARAGEAAASSSPSSALPPVNTLE